MESHTAGSTSIPRETKNRLLKTSRNGVISSTIRLTYFDSDTTIPARKAPSAIDRPKWPKTRAVPTATSTVVRVKSSRLPAATTRAARAGKSTLAPTTVRAMTPTARTRNHGDLGGVAPSPASSGSASMIGTTARSCISSTPIMARPWGLDVLPEPSSSHRTRAVDERAMTIPQVTASAGGRPRTMATAAAAAPVVRT